MEAEELDIDQELEELESRLDRLRSLYEQYFLGIEKIEPAVARKDVDRRIWVLRRAKFRNTAKRFKLQTLIMRYNTYQQYWQRICREIENGTYHRHMLKAEKLGEALTIATKKRRGMFARGEAASEARSRAEDASQQAAQDLAALLESPSDGALDTKQALDDAFRAVAQRAAAAPAAPSRPPAAAPVKRALGRLDLDLDLDLSEPSPARPAPPARPAQRPVSAAASPPAPAPARAAAPPARPAPPARLPPPARPPAAPPPVPARPAPAAPGPGGVSDQRVRELHARLVDAKRQTNDSQAVSMDGLAKTLKATESRLKQQHGNRQVDFDVVIRDGKAILKPIIK